MEGVLYSMIFILIPKELDLDVLYARQSQMYITHGQFLSSNYIKKQKHLAR